MYVVALREGRQDDKPKAVGDLMLAFTKPRTLLAAGIAGLVATWGYAVFFAPTSQASVEKRLGEAAHKALAAAGFGWAEAKADGQKIILSGVAPSTEARQAAIDIALKSEGEGGVISGGVSKVIARQLEVGPPVSPFILVATRDGRSVSISGVAPSRAAMAAVTEAARSLYGMNVQVRLRLASGAPAGVDWPLAAVGAVGVLTGLERGEAELVDGVLTVSGEAASDKIVADTEARLARVGAGVRTVSQVAGPAEFTASVSQGKLTFGGRVASEDARRMLAQLAEKTFPGNFEDQTRIGKAGDWDKRIAVALPMFSRFSQGVIRVQGKGVVIEGEAGAGVLEFMRQDMAPVKDDYVVVWSTRAAMPDMPEIEGLAIDTPGEGRRVACQTAFVKALAAEQVDFGDWRSIQLQRSSSPALDRLAALSKRCAPFNIEVRGHTDNRGPIGVLKTLSQRRATAVRDFLERSGVEPERLSVVGFGDTKPVATNRTERGRSQNTRIEIRVWSPEGAD